MTNISIPFDIPIPIVRLQIASTGRNAGGDGSITQHPHVDGTSACSWNSEFCRMFQVHGGASYSCLADIAFRDSISKLAEVIQRGIRHHVANRIQRNSSTPLSHSAFNHHLVDLPESDVLLNTSFVLQNDCNLWTSWKGILDCSSNEVLFVVKLAAETCANQDGLPVRSVAVKPATLPVPGDSGNRSAEPCVCHSMEPSLNLGAFWELGLDPMCIVDVHTRHFVCANPAFCNLLGYSEAEVVGKHWSSFIVQREAESANGTLAPDGFLLSAESFRVSRHHLTKDGRVIGLEWSFARRESGNVFYSIAKEVTNYEKLEHEEMVLRKFWNSSAEAFVVADRQTTVVRQCNMTAALIFGLKSTDELIGKPYMDLVCESHRQSMMEDIDRRSKVRETKMNTRDGLARWMQWTVLSKDAQEPVVWRTGDILSESSWDGDQEFLIVRDISSQKKQMELLVRQNEEKNVFLAMISEEIRTPLNAVRGASQLLAMDDRVRSSLDVFSWVEQIVAGCDDLMLMMDNLMTFSQIVAGTLKLVDEPFDLDKLVSKAVESTKNVLQRTVLHNSSSVVSQPTVVFLHSIDPQTTTRLIGDGKRLSTCLCSILYNSISSLQRIRFLDGHAQHPATLEIHVQTKDVDPDRHPMSFRSTSSSFRLSRRLTQPSLHPASSPPRTTLASLDTREDEEFVEIEGWTSARRRQSGPDSDFLGKRIMLEFVVKDSGCALTEEDVEEAFGSALSALDDNLIVRVQGFQSPVNQQGIAAPLSPNAGRTGNPRKPLVVNGDVGDVVDNPGLRRKLNLTVTYTLVRYMGGSMTVESGPQGTSIFFSVPVFENNTSLPTTPQKLVSTGLPEVSPLLDVLLTPPQSLRVLGAEDDIINSRVLSHMLGRFGLQKQVDYTMVVDGQLAVNAFIQSVEVDKRPFEAILMDLMMPVMDGFCATKAIRAYVASKQSQYNQGGNYLESAFAICNPTIIAITASVSEEDRLLARQCGVDYLVIKPIHAKELASMLAEIAESLGRKRLLLPSTEPRSLASRLLDSSPDRIARQPAESS
eukprot:ANDGO_01223.mRNA.1 Histidine protein kinase 1